MNLRNLLEAAQPGAAVNFQLPLAVVLSTTARPEYLLNTCRSLDYAGLAAAPVRRAVLYQGPAAVHEMSLHVPIGWEVFQTSRRLEGVVEATVMAMALADIQQAPYLLLFEDDLIAAPGGVDLMVKTEVPDDLAYLSFFDSRWLDPLDGDRNQILELRPNEGGPCHYGNLALKFPRRTLVQLADGLDDFAPTSPQEMDRQLPVLFKRCGRGRYGLYCPSLVQHVGARSGITPGEPIEGYGRMARNFVRLGDAIAQVYSSTPPRELVMTTRPGKG